MPSISSIQFDVNEHPGAGGAGYSPAPPHTVYFPGPRTTLRVKFDVHLSPSDMDTDWLGKVEIFGYDASDDEVKLVDLQWMGFVRVAAGIGPGGIHGTTFEPRFYTQFFVVRTSSGYSFDQTMNVDRVSLDSNPPVELTAITREYGVLHFLIPKADRIFARVTLTPSGGTGHANVFLDSETYEADFEWPEVTGA